MSRRIAIVYNTSFYIWNFRMNLIRALQAHLGPQAVFTMDSGNGTFLGMELLRLDRPGSYLAPIDYSCMGYSVPAAIGAALGVRSPVAALAGDGIWLSPAGTTLVACPPEQEAELTVSASYLDKQMRSIRETGKVIGLERIAVMAALNISHELLQATELEDTAVPAADLTDEEVSALTSKIDEALYSLRQMQIS